MIRTLSVEYGIKECCEGLRVSRSGYYQWKKAEPSQREREEAELVEMKRKVVELMPSHPVMPAVKAGARGAIRVTDCITQRQFHQTPHYVETLQPIDIHYQMVVTLDIPGKIAGMTFNRDKNFTDKEATLL